MVNNRTAPTDRNKSFMRGTAFNLVALQSRMDKSRKLEMAGQDKGLLLQRPKIEDPLPCHGTIGSLVRGIIDDRVFRYGTNYVCSGFINQPAGRFRSENALTVGLRYQSSRAAIEDHGTCMRWWKGDRHYSGRDQKHFHVALPLKLGARLRVSLRV